MITSFKSRLLPALALVMVAGLSGTAPAQQPIPCPSPYVVDGDTIHCGKARIRLYGIDAPELHGCPKGKRCVPGDAVAARKYLQGLTAGELECHHINFDTYGRSVADCSSTATKSLSCAMVAAGHAVERYGKLVCE